MAWRCRGGSTPGRRPMRSSADGHRRAGVAGRLTIADALPSRTSLRGAHQGRVLLAAHPLAGSSSIAMTSVQGTSSSPLVSPTARAGRPARRRCRLVGGSAAPRRSRPAPCRRPWRRRRPAAWPAPRRRALAPAAQVSRPRRPGDPCTSRSSGRPRAGLGRLAVRAHAARGPAQPPVAAWRLWPLALEVFFLGTAMVDTPDRSVRAASRVPPGGTLAALAAGASPPGRRPEHVEVSPPGVPGGDAATVALVAVGAALRAEARRSPPCTGAPGQLEDHRVPDHGAQVDPSSTIG